MSEDFKANRQTTSDSSGKWEYHKQSFCFNNKEIQLLIPDSKAIHQHYLQVKESEGKMFYWARLWPASIALCRFIADNENLFQHKKVAEIAAGLGLPSLLAAHYSKEVNCSDYNADAVNLMKQSVALNGLNNVECSVIDWHNIPEGFCPDVILLSDINYDPIEFIVLQQLITSFIQKGITVILCTPQRLVAKAFVEPLLHFCKQQENYSIDMDNIITETSLFVLTN